VGLVIKAVVQPFKDVKELNAKLMGVDQDPLNGSRGEYDEAPNWLLSFCNNQG
jgi:hypothetical protein